jgi:hypothetical protein
MRLAVFVAFLCCLASCYEPQEGCLDIEAINFSASADDHCCCIYPNLRFSVQHRMDSLVWQRDSVYQTPEGRVFRLYDAAFYLSGFQLQQKGTAYSITDQQAFDVFAAGATDTLRQIFTDDFVLVRRTTVDVPVGTFPTVGAFDQVQFRLGLTTDANRIIPTLAPSGHPLRTQGDSLWLNPQDGFVPLLLVLDRDTSLSTPPDTLRFARSELGDLFVLSTNNTFSHETGYDFRITLRIDYVRLFEGVDLSNPDINAVRAGIASNLSKAFSVVP